MMKMKASAEWTEQKNGGNAHCKYAIRGFKWHLPCDVVDVLFFVLLLRWFIANNHKQELNQRLAENKQKKITIETLIVNTPHEGSNGT